MPSAAPAKEASSTSTESDWPRYQGPQGDCTTPEVGWKKMEMVIQAGFEFFAENPDYVRLMRREALDGGSHLGIDLAAVTAAGAYDELVDAPFRLGAAPDATRTRRRPRRRRRS